MFFLTGSEAAALLTFDDGRLDQYTNAFPTLTKYGVAGTFYIHTASLGMSVVQMQEMYAAGNDMGNHTVDHVQTDGLSLVDATAEFAGCKTALDGWGMPRASSHVAYPYGRYGGYVLQAMAAAGMKTGRTCVQDLITMASIHDSYTPYQIPIGYVFLATSLAMCKSWLDVAKVQGRTIVFLFHTIIDTPTVEYQWATADLDALIAYGQSIGIPFLTITQWWANYTAKYGG